MLSFFRVLYLDQLIEFTQGGGASICPWQLQSQIYKIILVLLSEMGVVFMVDDDEGTSDQYSVLPIPQLPNQGSWALVRPIQ